MSTGLLLRVYLQASFIRNTCPESRSVCWKEAVRGKASRSVAIHRRIPHIIGGRWSSHYLKPWLGSCDNEVAYNAFSGGIIDKACQGRYICGEWDVFFYMSVPI